MKHSKQVYDDKDSRIDYGVILPVLLLSIISITTLFATTYLQVSNGSLRTTLMQVVWYVVGTIAIIVIMQFDSEQLWKLTTFGYWFGILLLVAVLFFHDRATAIETGAKSWFKFGGISFQPSEVVKIAYILQLAKVVTEHNVKTKWKNLQSDFQLLVKTILWAMPPLVLVILQNDLGTTLVFICILGGMLIMSGISWKILLPLIFIVGLIGFLLIYLVVYNRPILLAMGFKNYQFARIDSWLDPYRDQGGAGFQLFQSMKAIGSGRMFGKGYGVSEVYVPVRESDLIFATIGENFGFAGGTILILIYFILIYQMIRVCFDTKNEFYTYIATGVIMMILFHVVENIGMTIGLLPLTGIPLPFISQGGSSLLGNMMGIGLIMSMRYHYKSYIFEDEKERAL
ncbi:rod shape determining protein RodA [Granulicatella balaenopterae]|uniref:Rod shape determining protein RodA n=1 Tax=Granulicatella balaenopterae TaxID=137733 RepID=A0A1H9L9I4_9LACT|nr:FtsW/RodA/SpoVE family cell cycle protein [Granulicatella balaenopterae]SER08122.1 rod shape determining protein RodA [Granulicatella balaenopterae]